jgi:hypothetical protein
MSGQGSFRVHAPGQPSMGMGAPALSNHSERSRPGSTESTAPSPVSGGDGRNPRRWAASWPQRVAAPSQHRQHVSARPSPLRTVVT